MILPRDGVVAADEFFAARFCHGMLIRVKVSWNHSSVYMFASIFFWVAKVVWSVFLL